MNPYHQVKEAIKNYVSRLFETQQTTQLVYHNFSHTQDVISRSEEIASHYDLDEREAFVLFAAAWFHDTGHLFGPAAGHEERSVEKMKDFLEKEQADASIIESIAHCIYATKFPGQPESLPAEILCDADLYHLGTDEFLVTDEQVKREFGLRNNKVPANWEESTLSFLQAHVFFTDYCKKLLQAGKGRNIKLIKQRLTT